jgi:hypothetical protein
VEREEEISFVRRRREFGVGELAFLSVRTRVVDLKTDRM